MFYITHSRSTHMQLLSCTPRWSTAPNWKLDVTVLFFSAFLACFYFLVSHFIHCFGIYSLALCVAVVIFFIERLLHDTWITCIYLCIWYWLTVWHHSIGFRFLLRIHVPSSQYFSNWPTVRGLNTNNRYTDL